MSYFISADIWRRIHEHPRLIPVVLRLQNNISDPLPLSAAAKLVGMERTAFSRYFRRTTTIGYRHFIWAFRISHAMHLVQHSSSTITEIAFMVGFGDISTFERVYKRFAGYTPTESRRVAMQITSDDFHNRQTAA